MINFIFFDFLIREFFCEAARRLKKIDFHPQASNIKCIDAKMEFLRFSPPCSCGRERNIINIEMTDLFLAIAKKVGWKVRLVFHVYNFPLKY